MMYEKALAFAKRPEEKMLVLSGLANVATPQALKIIQPCLNDEAVASEALIAMDKIISQIEPISIFDGTTFNGWEGDLEIFRIEDGAIVAGTLGENVPRSEYLCTTNEYTDFELHVTAKLIGEGDNAGVQFRSRRVPNSSLMVGYQADMGSHQLSEKERINLWGCLYCERRHKFLEISDQQQIAKVFKPGDWNDIVIRCLGKRIQLWVNGYNAVDYVETDDSIEQAGFIGLQVHHGPPSKVWYKDVSIKLLEP